LRAYTSFDEHHKFVLANRLTFDGIIGDLPIQELSKLGGSADHYAFGGVDSGRGIRVQRYLGKLKVINMTELRWRFLDFDILSQQFGLTAVGFVDAALVGAELTSPRGAGVVGSTGGALRVSWNENFVVRCDVGVSPLEDWAPSLYLTIGNPF
jgi:hypothetical protein